MQQKLIIKLVIITFSKSNTFVFQQCINLKRRGAKQPSAGPVHVRTIFKD